MLDIIMEDEHILVVRKKAGIESQSGKSFAMDLASEIKTYLTNIYQKMHMFGSNLL